MSKLLDRWNPRFENASQSLLERAFRELTDMEVDCERKLKEIQEVKGRLLIEIELRVNKK